MYMDVEAGHVETFTNSIAPGNYSVTATYMGDSAFNTNTTSQDVEIIGHILIDTPITAYADVDGNRVALTVKVDENATGFVEIKSGDNALASLKQAGVNGTLTTTLPYGSYSLDITYLGDENYNKNSTICEFTIVEPVASIVVIDDIADVVYNASVEVTYTLENGTLGVRDANGNKITTGVNTTVEGKVIITGLDAGKYTISISNVGDISHPGSDAEATFSVLKATITIDPVATGDMVVDGDVNVTFTVPTDIDGMVSVTIDGQPVLSFIIINGTCTIPGTYAAGPHTVTVKLAGDTNYENAVGQTTFDIAKVVMEMNATIEADAAVGDVNVTVTLPEDATGHVLVYVDDMFITSVPVNNGTAAFPIYGFDAGEHNLTVTYDGDDKYTNGTFKAPFETEKVPTNTTINATVEGFDVEITVYVNSTVVVNGGKLTLTFNDENVTADVVIGVAVFKFSDLPGKTYNITAVYGGNGQFLSSNDTGSAKVLRKSAYLKPLYEPFIFNYGQLYKFRLADKDGNPIAGRT